ncbi:MAG: nucleoside-diphosphate sugar epimerase/dehydratase [Mariprofundaceae bacterium]|nr:nucleoside-diphosphate sugar epimerase/dehydratase [Mariprofundaceae bacterium]
MTEIGRRLAIVSHDLLMVSMAWLLAYLVRYNFALEMVWVKEVQQSLPVVMLVQGLVAWYFGLYKGVWRFASIPDLWNIIRTSAFGALAVALALFLAFRLEGVPRAVLVLYPVFLVLFLGAPRACYRLWRDHGLNLHKISGRKQVLIIGAGRAGEMLARDMWRDNEYFPIGFLDDKKRLTGAKVHGISVLGAVAELGEVVRKNAVDTVVIAMPSATSAQMQQVVELCERVKVPFRTVPPMKDLMAGRVSVNELRDVSIDDLLGRDPVSLDWGQISSGLSGKSVLVSGGGGSIGTELCRQIARLRPGRLVILERCEFNLYSIEQELSGLYPSVDLIPCLGDVADAVAVDHVVNQHRPDIVFHAAAYKHVPMLQDQSREALRNNVLGTQILALAADRHGCSTFIMISTDKAVNPTSVMGASKRVAELYCQALNQRSGTRFITVRFGNVLGSAGSVVPLFQRQIASGGPVTVTHPDIIRYFMTIPEASQLIMQAAVMGKGGEIFVLDMGEPVRIQYLAEQMIRLSGKIPGEDINFEYIGLRPGEKLYEELFYGTEKHLNTGHDKILLANSAVVEWEKVNSVVEGMKTACANYDVAAQFDLLRRLVPELPGREVGKKVGINMRDVEDEKIIPFDRHLRIS